MNLSAVVCHGDTTMNRHAVAKFARGRHAGSHRRRWLVLALMLLLGINLGGCGLTSKTTRPVIRGLYDAKSAVVQEAADTTTDAPSALKRAGQALQLGDKDEALYYYVRALEFDETNREALDKIGDIHSEKNNDAMAEVAYRLALKQDPKDADALAGLGLVQFRGGKMQDATQSLSGAVAINPKLWRAYNALGMMADKQGDHTKALQYYDKALQTEPNNPVVLNNIGYSKYLAGDLRGALQMFESALRFDPKYDSAWLNKGLVYARLDDEELALEAFKHVLNEADAYNNLGYIWMMDGKTDAAYRCFQRAISLSPTYHVLAHENLKRLESMNK